MKTGKQIVRSHATGLLIFHGLTLYALFFTHPGVGDLILAVLFYVIRVLGITAGYHRYFTHQSFQASKITEAVLAVMGNSAGEGPVKRWVANHWRHHRYADREKDPHSPERDGFWYAHLGWLLDAKQFELADQDQKRFHFSSAVEWVNENSNALFYLQALLVLVLSFVGSVFLPQAFHGMATGFSWTMGVSLVVGLHATFSVNSLAHVLGYKNHATADESRNNAWVAFFTLGEGWHNNHHARPSQVRHGERLHEMDVTYYFLCALRALKCVSFKIEPLTPGQKIVRSHFIGTLIFHGIALWAVFFTSPGVGDLGIAAALYCIRVFGITAGYHRYLSHKSYQAHPAFETALAVMGNSSGQGPLKRWVANHIEHHRYSDSAQDPHSPVTQGFWHAHMGWLFNAKKFDHAMVKASRLHFSKHVEWVDRHSNALFFAQIPVLFFVHGLGHAFYPHYFHGAGIGLGWSMGVSLVLGLHAIFLTGSLSHSMGYRNFKTHDESRNNIFISAITLGEGWHNNHHAWPQSVKHGLKPYEVDLNYLIIKFFSQLGMTSRLIVKADPFGSFSKRASEGLVRLHEPNKSFPVLVPQVTAAFSEYGPDFQKPESQLLQNEA